MRIPQRETETRVPTPNPKNEQNYKKGILKFVPKNLTESCTEKALRNQKGAEESNRTESKPRESWGTERDMSKLTGGCF